MVAASRIKGCSAEGTGIITIKILSNTHLGFAGSAEDRFCVPFILRPALRFVAGRFLVAMVAGVIRAAAPEFYCDDIER